MSRSLTSRAALMVPSLRRVLEDRDATRAECKALRKRAERLKRERDALRRQYEVLLEADTSRWNQLRYVFIATYGRSGSTLLQGILNATPGYLIRGENDSALFHLFRYHQLATERRDLLKGRHLTSAHPYFGIDGYPDEVALAQLRSVALKTILRPEPDTRVTGVKEIRWNDPRVPQFVAFLQQAFPGSRFLINTRDNDQVSRSKWWAKRPNALEQIRAREAKLLDLAAVLGDDAYHVHYNDYVADPTVLEGMFSWLGEDFDLDRVAATLATPHSY